ncbi:MAG: enoyl-CoA hydratase/isomerase family protein [Firmicutes bacterium]|nr:enoyl-CoA hydratase/isomerase family protein [Bacillota bacterium]
MTYQNILYETAEGIAWITLNRPERLNSLSPEMLDEWIDAVGTAGRDEAVRVVVVTGAGRAFCTGLDLKSLGEAKIENGEVGGERDAAGTGVIAAIQNCQKPVIGMVNGYCFTGGLEILFGFDIVIASEEAKFADTHAKWGLRPTWGLSQRMPRMLGVNKAKELSFTCRTFSAEDAREFGLVNHVVPADRLREETIALGSQIISNSVEAIAAIKDLYNKGMQMTLQDGLDYERDAHYPISDTKERLFGFNK